VCVCICLSRNNSNIINKVLFSPSFQCDVHFLLTIRHTMRSTHQVHFGKTVVVIIIIAIMLFVLPVQSMLIRDSARDKRWTFNSWRLHGRREASDLSPLHMNDMYAPMAPPSEADLRYQLVNIVDGDDDDAFKTLEHLLRLLQALHQEHKDKNSDGNIKL